MSLHSSKSDDVGEHSQHSGTASNTAHRSNQSNLDEISIDSEYHKNDAKFQRYTANAGLKYLPRWPPVNIEFQDLVYSVPNLGKGKKVILRGVTGKFHSNQLIAILGASGSGKTSLLNILAGYKCSCSSGQVCVNGRPRNMKTFRKMSRYIMQNEVFNPHLTVREAMTVSADLKLGSDLTRSQKDEVIDEIIELLRLTKSQNTRGKWLSGGERKRLSIALELVNNPPVLILDEPTTGLDDLASSQCISVLQRIAHGGRTVICSIHTPSAKAFAMFDHVYFISEGQCVYQGSGSSIVQYMQTIGLQCPVTYNPADFIIDVSVGEYGHEYLDKMVTAVENGRSVQWMPKSGLILDENHIIHRKSLKPNETHHLIEQFEEEIDPKHFKRRSTWWQQFIILFRRMTLQMWRDTAYIKLKFVMTIILGLIVGGIYQGVGNDATKALFNFGFAFNIIIAYLYKPMMPVLLQFPTEVRLLKKEYFNQWYKLSPYYCAMIVSKLPIQLMLALIYLTMIYFMTSQPLEIDRIAMLYTIAVLVAMTSDSFGTLIASRLSIVNAIFIGPVITVPLMLLSTYGIGYGREIYIPAYIRVLMSLSYLRHGMEGIVAALYGNNRADTICPPEEMLCIFRKSKFLLTILGFENVDYTISVCALLGYYLIFTLAAFWMIKRRLAFTTTNNVAVQYISHLVKTHLNFGSYKY